jgi:acylglycerol lipase
MGQLDLYCNDKLVTAKPVSARLGAEMLNTIDVALEEAPKIEIPYLLIRGSDDQVCLLPGIEKFHQLTSSQDKSFMSFEGLYHEIFNEMDTPALPVVMDWLRKRIGKNEMVV